MKKTYNKLVRDKIPDIIRAQGKTPVTHTLSDSEYLTALQLKLQEEVAEYLHDNNVEEICDIIEVLYALLACMGVSKEEAEEIRQDKEQRNGAFAQRIFLKDIIS